MSDWIEAAWLLPEEEDWRWEAVTDVYGLNRWRIVTHFSDRLFLGLDEPGGVLLTLCSIPGVRREGDWFVVAPASRTTVDECLSWSGIHPEWRIERMAAFESAADQEAFEQAMETLQSDSPMCDSPDMHSTALPERRPGG